ncbi:acetyl-CoA C-acetyltransferase [Aureimonas fodinaquatilis]|uniref:Acetyl-CoA C-acetyltransferase n=1 Tax=Aureimonas fodinaquatilis TaxID=2565783 RepID=A0A5B0E072_9HYPH|nr:acetyl-CoA C-acetyltransferase [Aureimonas fodinaquatilis]KAA0972464.1 acetyl-CoA C-acetyltransferase [Aureimonas fodinaquatilis]
MTRAVYIVDGARTPFLKARGKPGPFTPVDLAVQCGRPLLLRQGFDPALIDLVILGCVNVIADEMNPARVAGLRLGLPEATPAYTVQINCGSGMQSIDSAFRTIEAGHADIVLAGGTEALSHSPLVLRKEAVDWFAALNTARSTSAKLKAISGLRPGFLKPEIGLERGLTDPITNLGMGQTAEKIGHLFGITREAADAYAVESHKRLAAAQAEGRLADEVFPAFSRDGQVYTQDDGVRADSTVQSLGALKPVFEKPYGKVTAGNSSQITDGASWVLLAGEEAVAKHSLTVLAKIVDSHWGALDPSIMGLGPVVATAPVLKRQDMRLADVDLWELNEAFAAQVLACLAAFEDEEVCRDVLGLDGAAGTIPRDRLNVDGGAISLGHPVGTSGTRITLHLANALRQRGLRRGIATECIGGGQGGAMLLETA